MVLADIFFSLVISMFFMSILIALGPAFHHWRRLVAVFVVIFLGSWAGGIWITPVGPNVMGVYWLSAFVVGLLFTLAMSALAVRRTRRRERTEGEVAGEERELEAVIDAFIWILVGSLVVLIVFGYVHHRKFLP